MIHGPRQIYANRRDGSRGWLVAGRPWREHVHPFACRADTFTEDRNNPKCLAQLRCPAAAKAASSAVIVRVYVLLLRTLVNTDHSVPMSGDQLPVDNANVAVGHIAENCQAPGRLCYNCREPGHESTACPQPRSTDGKQCYGCGGVGTCLYALPSCLLCLFNTPRLEPADTWTDARVSVSWLCRPFLLQGTDALSLP